MSGEAKIMARLRKVELSARQANARAARLEAVLRLKAPCVEDVHVWVGNDEWCLCKTRVRARPKQRRVDLSRQSPVEH
jgi:hypothetical protein